MTRSTVLGGAAVVAVLFLLTLAFLIARSRPVAEAIETTTPRVTEIVV